MKIARHTWGRPVALALSLGAVAPASTGCTSPGLLEHIEDQPSGTVEVDLARVYGPEWTEYAFTCGYSSATYAADRLGVEPGEVPDLSTAYAGEAVILRSAGGEVTYDLWPRSRIRYCATGEPYVWHRITPEAPLVFEPVGVFDGQPAWSFVPPS